MRRITLPDGRALSFHEWGPADGPLLIHQHGVPGSRLELSVVADQVAAAAEQRHGGVQVRNRLATGADLSHASAETLRRWLGAGMDLSMVASAFGLDPLAHYYFDRGIWLWNKTGTISTVRADIGVVMSQTRRIAYAVLANWDSGADVRDDVLAAMRAAGDVLRAELGFA